MMSSSVTRGALLCLVLVGMIAVVSGCGGGGASSENFALRMVDSGSATRGLSSGDGLVGTRAGYQGIPPEATALRVTIDEIRAIPEAGPPIRLNLATSTIIDVMQLPASFTVLEQDLPPGNYVKLELIVTSAEMDLPSGTVPVEVPSGAQTGLKLPIQYPITDGFNTVLQLDWNTGNSVHCTGNGQWKMRPTALTVTDITQQETVDNVTVVGTSLAPAQANPGATNVGMLKLDLTVDDNFATIQDLTVALLGTGTEADVDTVKVWLDGGDGVFNPSDVGTDDAEIGSALLDATPKSVDIADQTFTMGTTLTLFVSYNLAAGATVGNTVGVSVTAMQSPDTITGLPVNSGLTQIAAP